MRRIKRDIVSALIFSKDGKIFQGRKAPEKRGVYYNCWHLPGGGIENNEEKEGALIREIKEEVGIDISGYPTELINDSGRGKSKKILETTGEKIICEMKFFVYKVIINDKSANEIRIKLGSDLTEYSWVKPSKLKEIKLTPPSVGLFKRLGYIK